MKAIVVAGAASNAGKTTVTLALIAACRRRGLTVQPFKVGPDYIDPGHHLLAAGRVSHNLDNWMLTPEQNQQIFTRYTSDADIAIIEGVMGIYDSINATSDLGSTASLAKQLELQVLLVIDAKGQARTLAALALGLAQFDINVKWQGLLANRVGSKRHADLLAESLAQCPSIPWFGGLLRQDNISLPERHLGLITSDEYQPDFSQLADWIEQSINIDQLIASIPDYVSKSIDNKIKNETKTSPNLSDKITQSTQNQPLIAVAKDAAFCFYYQENLRLLTDAGAKLVYFSPLHDTTLPPDCSGVFLGGGYPELHAAALAANATMLVSIKKFADQGGIIYAECGGLMYLGQSIISLQCEHFPMAGVFDWVATMNKRRQSLGYRQVLLNADCILGNAGTIINGHEFHYSTISRPEEATIYTVYNAQKQIVDSWGFRHNQVLCSYVHLHFASCPQVAKSIVDSCRKSQIRG